MPLRSAPLLTFAEAEAVGQQLHDHFVKMSGEAPMTREDMGWGDVVQFVLRSARNAVEGRPAVEMVQEGGDGR